MPRATIYIIAISILATSPTALAQEHSAPMQITGEWSELGLAHASTSNEGTGVAGFGVRFDVGLSRRVDVESRLNWFPGQTASEFQAQGGRTLQLAVGARGKLFVSRRVSLYGLLLPGLVHFSNTFTSVSGNSLVTGGATHFALDTGLGVEFFPTSRWTLRGELTGPLYGAPGGELARFSGSSGNVAVLSEAARFVNLWQASAGIGYRLGSMKEDKAEEPVAGRWEVGGQIAQGAYTDALGVGESFFHRIALGGFASYRITPLVYADAAFNAFLGSAPQRTLFDGGYLLEGLGGVKFGMREEHYGFFLKALAGVDSHSGALSSQNASGQGSTTSRSSALAVAVGAVVETYFGRRWLVRFDGGDVISMFRSRTLTEDGVSTWVQAPDAAHSLQMTIGFGTRF